MGKLEHDIPDITVVITKGDEYTTAVTPSELYQVIVNTGDNYVVNIDEPDVITTDGSGSYIRVADYATYALTSSFAQTASYISGSASDWTYITNKPTGIVSSSQQAVSWSVATASFARNATLPAGTISSSNQVLLNQIRGNIFSSSNFTFPQNLTITGSVFVNTSIQASSITGSFKGDGSQLTGLVTDLRISGSTGSDTVSLLTDTLSVIGQHPVRTTVTNNQIAISIPTGYATTGSNRFVGDQTITGSVDVTGDIWVTPGVVNQLTSSYAIKAENIGIISAGIYATGSQQPIAPTTGITRVTSASYALTASYAMNAGGALGGVTSSLLSIDSYYFIGDGITTTYVLPKIYTDYSLIVSVGGVTFMSPNDYTITENTISFVEAPYSSSNIFVRGFVNVTTNVTGSFSGSLTGISTNAITASYVSEVLLANTAPIVPKRGSVYFSGSFLYVYDGVQYRSASLN